MMKNRGLMSALLCGCVLLVVFTQPAVCAELEGLEDDGQYAQQPQRTASVDYMQTQAQNTVDGTAPDVVGEAVEEDDLRTQKLKQLASLAECA